MAPQLLKFGISISLVEPGPVSTPFMENIDKNTAAAKESAAKEPSDDYTSVFWPRDSSTADRNHMHASFEEPASMLSVGPM